MISLISGEYPPDVGGVGEYTAHLRTALADSGWQSAVVSRRQVRRWDVRSLVWLIRHAPRRGIVHIQFQAGAYDLLGDVCLVPALLRRVRPRDLGVVTTFHDVRLPYLFPRAGRLRPAAVMLLARTSDAVIAADGRDLEWLSGPGPRQHKIPIGSNVPCGPPPGYDRATFRVGLNIHPGDLAVVNFGLVGESEGLNVLLDAFEHILVQRPRARLLLLGGQTAASVRARLDRLRDHVVQPGWLPPPELSAYLLAGDVALLPYADGASARRGSLLACGEHGLPIVSTQPTGSEIAPFIEAVTSDAITLAEAVLSVQEDPERFRAKSRALAETTSWQRIAAEHARVYSQLLHSQAS